MKRPILLILALFLTVALFAQGNKQANPKDLIQLSGVVVTSDSLQGLPYATVIIKGTGRGTVTNYQGFFSLVVAKGDKIVFSSVGYKDRTVTIPDTVKQSKYSIVQVLTSENYNLPEAVIYPWPTKEQFKDAFISLHIPDDQLEIAKKNLEKQKLAELGEMMVMDGNENTDNYMRQEAQKFYYAGQVPPMNIFNPIAWAKFIEAWKKGDFKKKN